MSVLIKPNALKMELLNYYARRKSENELSMMWEKYEDSFIWEKEIFEKDHPDLERVCYLLPNRTELECLVRKIFVITAVENPEVGYVEEAAEDEWLYFLPHSMDNIPVLPFLKICSFLTYQQVFKVLPLVCSHFRRIIQAYAIPITTLEITDVNYLNPVMLATLTRRTTDCERISMIIKTRIENPEFWIYLIEKLITKNKRTLREFTYESDWVPGLIERRDLWDKIDNLKLSMITNRRKRSIRYTWGASVDEWYFPLFVMDVYQATLLDERMNSEKNIVHYRCSQNEGFQQNSTDTLELTRIVYTKGRPTPNTDPSICWDHLASNVYDEDSLSSFLSLLTQIKHLRSVRITLSSHLFAFYPKNMRFLSPDKYLKTVCNALADCKFLSRIWIRTANLDDVDPYLEVVSEQLRSLPERIYSIQVQRRAVR
jgi:hypothetical protein